MANIVRKLHVPRRAFLRGAGASLALPWLDAMAPALRPRRRRPEQPTRALFVFAPNGVNMDEWRPTAAGPSYELQPTLAPLAPVRDRVTVLSGLDLEVARSQGDGPGDHARAAAAFLTCTHPVKTGGADVRAAISVDQVVAQALGQHTRFPSLELGMEGGRSAGVCDSGYSCAYSNNVAWRSPTTPVAKETRAAAVFTRLFGDPADHDRERTTQRRRELRSVLDAVRGDARDLEGRLSGADRAKLDQYLTAVRELEQRLARADREANERPAISVPQNLAHPRSYSEHLDLMYELIALAFQTDATRTITFMLGNAGSDRSYPFLGISDGHHYLSHHRGDPDKHQKIATINRFHVERFAALLTRLRTTDEAGTNLLDRSMIVFGSGIADGNRHDHVDLPILLAGGGNGTLYRGRHIACKKGTPLANLYLSLMARLGIERERHGDSTGPLGQLGPC